MSFGNVLKRLRKNKKITQTELARDLNVSGGAVAMWETDKRQPDHNTLQKIANYFNVTVDYLLERSNTLPSILNFTEVELNYIKEYKELFKNPQFNDMTKLFKQMDDATRIFILAYTIGFLNTKGINTKSILGY